MPTTHTDEEMTPDEFRALMQQSVDEIVGPIIRLPNPDRIPYDAAPQPHPIAKFFSSTAIRNAVGCYYSEISNFGSRKTTSKVIANHSRALMRWGHLPEDWPAPLAYQDYGGAGLTAPFSPLGYLLYHDRRESFTKIVDDGRFTRDKHAPECLAYFEQTALEALVNGAEWAGRYLLEAGRLRAAHTENPKVSLESLGVLKRQESALWHHCFWYNRVWADPSGIEVATLVMQKRFDLCTPEEQLVFTQIVEHAEDFSARWKRGEWFRAKGQSRVLASVLRSS